MVDSESAKLLLDLGNFDRRVGVGSVEGIDGRCDFVNYRPPSHDEIKLAPDDKGASTTCLGNLRQGLTANIGEGAAEFAGHEKRQKRAQRVARASERARKPAKSCPGSRMAGYPVPFGRRRRPRLREREAPKQRAQRAAHGGIGP